MRENIGLFKAKRIDNNEWVEGYYVKCRGKHYILQAYNENGYDERWELSDWIEINSETLCEFTGLCDKNGNKIFENDILDYWENGKENIKQRLKVFYENGQFVVDHYAINLLNSRNMSSEIIGNIFDNKELLGE